jgi:hypothetical protein
VKLRIVGALAIAACGVAQSLGAADLCVEGLCIVRAQVAPTHGLMTRYQPLLLIMENRTGRPISVAGFDTDVADEVQVLYGDEWDVHTARPLVIGPNEYRTLGASTPARVLMVGLRRPLEPGDILHVRMSLKSRKTLAIPVRVLEQ